MSWGAGLSGFVTGIDRGISIGQKIKEIMNQNKLDNVRAQGLAEAQAMQAAAAPQVSDNGDMQNLTVNPQQSVAPNQPQQPAPGSVALGILQQNQAAGLPVSAPEQQPVADLSSVPQASQAPVQQAFESASPMAGGIQLAAPKRFDVGGKQFDDKKAADSYAKSQAPAIEEFYATTLVPRMKEALVGQGKLKEAEAWQTYADDSKTKKAMKTWGEAFQFAQLGDYNQSAQRLMKLHPDFDDGYELVSAKPTKGPDGADGFTMKLRDEEGNEQEVFHDARTITEVGLSQLSPIEMFNQRFKRQNQADTLQARAAIDATNDQRTAQRTLGAVAVREQGQNNRLETRLEADKEKLDRTEAGKDRRVERQGQLAAERDANRIKAAGTYRKDASPEEQRRIVWQTLSRDALFGTSSPEEQEERVNQALQFIQGGKKETPAQSGTSTTANPFQGSGAQSGVPVFRNGRIERVQR